MKGLIDTNKILQLDGLTCALIVVNTKTTN